MVVSAYAAYAVNNAGVTMWLAAPAAVVAGALLSEFLNNVIYTPFQRRGTTPIAMVIVYLGMTLILDFGTPALAGPQNALKVCSFELTVEQVVIIALSIVSVVLGHVLIRHTRLGKAMRATSANRTLARNCGIRTDRVVTLTWLITG